MYIASSVHRLLFFREFYEVGVEDAITFKEAASYLPYSRVSAASVAYAPLPFYQPPSFSALSHRRDNAIHVSEEELLKRYLKQQLPPNGCVLRSTGC